MSPEPCARQMWLDRIAEQLARLAIEIESLGGELCADAEMMARNITALQAIDAIAQQQHCLAGVLRADDYDRAVDALTFAELKERLRAA